MKSSIDEIMVRNVVSINPDVSIREACVLMAERKIGATIVMDGKKLVGMFSERDLLNRVTAKNIDPDKAKISEVMTSPVITITSNTSFNDALYIMTSKHIRHIPVVDSDGELEGMVGIRDLLQAVLNDTIEAFVTDKNH